MGMNTSRAGREDAGDRPLRELITILGSDVNCLMGHMIVSAERGFFADEDAPYARSLVRALFAFVEGTCNAIKVNALGNLYDAKELVEPGIHEVVFEERYDLDERGNLTVKPLPYSYDKNIKFAFALWARSTNKQNPLDTSEAWWSALKEVARVRDRLMHPKTPEDLDLGPPEVARCSLAWSGFNGCVKKLVGADSED